MKLFRCDHCRHLVYFENYRCLSCDHVLAFLPDVSLVASLDENKEDGTFTSPAPSAVGRSYRLCSNYVEHNICNWTVPADSPFSLCVACRTTHTIPDLSVPGHKGLWGRLEAAKRRLIYTLLQLKLPVEPFTENPETGLTFEFLADPPLPGAPPIMTGHENGVITLNLAEADDAERERRRTSLHEPYRTLLGHFRHEIGHYYWDRLIRDSESLESFRTLFGDERVDYNEALRRHYAEGPPADWQTHYVSAYASAHPWEDWAETWAHYLHMVDTLETGAACGVQITPLPEVTAVDAHDPFALRIETWHALIHVLNNLNRSLGLGDAYPFVLPNAVLEKLRYVDQIVNRRQQLADANETTPGDGGTASSNVAAQVTQA